VPCQTAIEMKRALNPSENEKDQSNNEKGTDYAAANVHVNLQVG
jgi:hypothetical protein